MFFMGRDHLLALCILRAIVAPCMMPSSNLFVNTTIGSLLKSSQSIWSVAERDEYVLQRIHVKRFMGGGAGDIENGNRHSPVLTRISRLLEGSDAYRRLLEPSLTPPLLCVTRYSGKHNIPLRRFQG